MAQNFQPGDTVRLKSGGPLMTVKKVADQENVWCTWFKDDKPETHSFPATSLEKED